MSRFRRSGEVPDFQKEALAESGNEARLITNAVIILAALYFLSEAIGFERAVKAAVIAAVCFVIFSVYTVIASFFLKKICGFKYVAFEIEKGLFPTFVMKPPADPLSYGKLYMLFFGEILLSFVPAISAVVLIFSSGNFWFLIAAVAMVNWALLFCFKVEGNLNRFGRFRLLAGDYTAADTIGRVILIGYNYKKGERLRDMDKLLFIAPNKPDSMFDYKQMIYAYSYALETSDYKRVIMLTEMLSGKLPRGIAGITERHCITADKLLAMILSNAPIADIKKLYADNRSWLLETYSDNALNIRVQTVLYAYIKIILSGRADKAASDAANERFWQSSERVNMPNLVSCYAEKLLEIENRSREIADGEAPAGVSRA
jgi:hypothetical protein